MPDAASDDQIAYHLMLDPPEAEIASRALRLLISDEAHEPAIRALAREVIELLAAGSGAAADADSDSDSDTGADAGAQPTHVALTIPLTAPQMKIAHTAVRLLLLDTQRDQESERQLLHAILEKLPDEHALRAIELD